MAPSPHNDPIRMVNPVRNVIIVNGDSESHLLAAPDHSRLVYINFGGPTRSRIVLATVPDHRIGSRSGVETNLPQNGVPGRWFTQTVSLGTV